MIRICGASDDLVEIEGDVSGELGSWNKSTTLIVGTKEAGLRVILRYAATKKSPGVRRVAVEPIDEGIPMPWPVSVTLAPRGYSPMLTIDAPVGTPVTWRGKPVR